MSFQGKRVVVVGGTSGQMVSVTEKGAHLSNGALAGSMLTMDQAIRHFRQATNCSFTELVSMSSTNAAKQLKRRSIVKMASEFL